LQSASIGVRLITIFTFDSCFHDSRGQKSIIRIVCLISDNVAIHVSLRQQINLQQSMLRSWNRKNIFIVVVVVVVVVVETVQTIATSAATTNDAVATTNDDDDDGALSADVSAVTSTVPTNFAVGKRPYITQINESVYTNRRSSSCARTET
jgi:hypothetical protein